VDHPSKEQAGIDDMTALHNSCSQFPLDEIKITHNEKNMGCSLTREYLLNDLRELILENSKIKKASLNGKLFFQFLDTDDIIHPDLLRIEMTAAQLTGAPAINCEHCIRMFDRYSVARLEIMEVSCSMPDFDLVKRNPTDLYGDIPISADGRMVVSSTAPLGYLPLLLKFVPEIFCLFLPSSTGHLFETMQPLLNQYEKKEYLVIPKNDAISLYFYRQHSNSSVHSIAKLGNNGLLTKLMCYPELLSSFIPLFINCDLENFEKRYSEIAETQPHLKNIVSTIFEMAYQKRDELETSSRQYMEQRREAAKFGFKPGLSWEMKNSGKK
jgi:hypothetical protein